MDWIPIRRAGADEEVLEEEGMKEGVEEGKVKDCMDLGGKESC